MISFQSDKVVIPASNLNAGSTIIFTPTKDNSGNTIYKVIAYLNLPTNEVISTRAAWEGWTNKGRPTVGSDSSYMINFDDVQVEYNNINLQGPYGGIAISPKLFKIVASTPNFSLYELTLNEFIVFNAQTDAYTLVLQGTNFMGEYYLYKKN